MAASGDNSSRRSQDLVDTSLLHTIIPQSSTFTVEDALQKLGSTIRTPKEHNFDIKQRNLVFFGTYPPDMKGPNSYLFTAR